RREPRVLQVQMGPTVLGLPMTTDGQVRPRTFRMMWSLRTERPTSRWQITRPLIRPMTSAPRAVTGRSSLPLVGRDRPDQLVRLVRQARKVRWDRRAWLAPPAQ